MARVLVIPDFHEPHSHPLSIKFTQAVQNDYKTNKIILLGDEVDHHALSRFPKSTLSPGGQLEMDQAIDALESWYKAFPRADVCVSNHTSRPYRIAELMGLSRCFLKEYRQWLQAPVGWKWFYDGELIVDKVLYIHGDHFTGKMAHITAATRNRCSVVIGHIHAHAGVQYMNGFGKNNQIFALNSGCLIADSWAFDYARKQPDRPVLGCSVVLEGKSALFIPLQSYYENV